MRILFSPKTRVFKRNNWIWFSEGVVEREHLGSEAAPACVLLRALHTGLGPAGSGSCYMPAAPAGGAPGAAATAPGQQPDTAHPQSAPGTGPRERQAA